jgi:predicted flap endonuclease-1-like 5' DNA nuclease
MYEYLQDPVFYWLVWGIFTVSGVILGWTLRAAYPEKEVVRNLERSLQERNTLGRLYTHLKYQHDLREADFKRASVEASALQARLHALQAADQQRETAETYAQQRAAKAEELAARLRERVQNLETHLRGLSAQNAQLNTQLSSARQEIDAWQALYKDFQAMQQKFAVIEQNGMALEAERNALQRALATAQAEIAKLQQEILVERQSAAMLLASSGDDSTQGGPATELQDDFTLIEGVSAGLGRELRDMGILRFEDICLWDDDAIINIARQLNISPGKIYKEDWVGQAKQIVGDFGD